MRGFAALGGRALVGRATLSGRAQLAAGTNSTLHIYEIRRPSARGYQALRMLIRLCSMSSRVRRTGLNYKRTARPGDLPHEFIRRRERWTGHVFVAGPSRSTL